MLELNTLNDVLAKIAGRGGATVCMAQAGPEWQSISAKQMVGRIRAVMATLDRWGIQPGDRVALVSENRWEWPVTDFGILAVGAVDVPLYQTLTPDQMGYILRDSGAKAIFLSSRDQYEKLTQAGNLPELEHVAVFDPGSFNEAESFADILKDAASLEQADDAFFARLSKAQPEDLATIVYTSGTTGDPKGVMLTHKNMAQNLRYSTDDLDIVEGDSSISFLPLSHALARHLDYALFANKAVIAYEPRFDNLAKTMKEIRPTVFLAVPRVFEKIRQGVEGKSEGVKKAIVNWALGVGRANQADTMRGVQPSSLSWKIADKLVYSKIREAFGGRAKVFISGGAPLGKETSEWFLSIGIRIFEGYGLTETSPVMSRNTFRNYRVCTVGEVLPNVEVRIASDGEVETRGDSIFKGYWRKPEVTDKEFTADGWFKTGDIGKLEDGFLSITDRKKELLKTSGGKYIAPQPIESKLKADSMVGQVAVIGDNKKFPAVLISPNFPALESWARKNGVAASDRKALVADPKVVKLYKGIVDGVNGSLAHFEALKKTVVVPEEWTIETGELTPSMKLKRRVINENYKDTIDAIYKE